MKFVFNDSLTASISVSDQNLTDIRFVPSGIILEKKIVTSATLNNLDELFEAIKGFKTEKDVLNFIKTSTDAQNILKNPEDLFKFSKKLHSMFGSSSSGGSSLSDPVAIANQMIGASADEAGEPASRFAPYLSSKDQIIARLKPFMSDKQIGDLFYKFEEVVKLPFTEIIGILEYCIQQSRSCNAKVKDLIDFYIDHYSQKRQGANTKRIIETACQYQKLNPTVDIFSVLRDAVHGNQPKVGLGYLSKDPDAQLVFDNLIMLSQASLPEQDEEIRRRFQASRDALQNQEQKINMQRAIYDMMKTEERNLQLAKMIKGLGSTFEFLLTQPMYRALKDMYYNLSAGRILMNQTASIFGGDTSPENRRVKPSEQQAENENTFPQIPENKQPFSNSQYNFLKLASPEVSKHIYAQTAPTTTPEQKKEAENGLTRIWQSVRETANKVIQTIKEKLSQTGQVIDNAWQNIIGRIANFFKALENAVKSLLNQIASNTITFESVAKAFSGVLELLQGGTGFEQSSTKIASVDINRTSQRAPQQGTTYPGGNKANQIALNTIGLLSQIGGFIIGAIGIERGVAVAIGERNWPAIVNAILPVMSIFISNLQEFLLQTNAIGKNAPQSSMFFDPKTGKMTQQGLQIMANNQETMISLGIADEDAMALSKFRIQKQELMSQLSKKESSLELSESQTIQTGGGNKETTVGDLPADFQVKLKDFLDFCEKVELQFKAALNIFRNAINNNQQNYNDVQKTQAQGLLAEFEKDLKEVQAKKSEWSSMKNIAGHMMRKRILLQKLKPLQTQLDTLKKLGIPMSNIIASPNGILSQVGRIRSEEQQALDKLRKEYHEKMQLLKNPDIIAPMMQYPTDTGMTKLPESKDQSNTNKSPFDAPKDSQFKIKEEDNTGVE
jgi:hypothetical protein